MVGLYVVVVIVVAVSVSIAIVKAEFHQQILR